jgi:hypothetical protein
LFHKLSKFVSSKLDFDEECEFEFEDKDMFGFTLSKQEIDFGAIKTIGKAVPENIRVAKLSTMPVKASEKSVFLAPHVGASTQMTSLLSNSKVGFSQSSIYFHFNSKPNFAQVVSLNENLARDFSNRNIVKTKVRSKWIPNEHTGE